MRDERTYLEDILEAIDAIGRFVEEMDYEAFKNDDKTFSAVLRKLEIIGEATKNISEETKTAHPDAPWRAAAGMRDRLIHGYFIVEERIIWSTIHQSLPLYGKKIREILDAIV